MDVTDYLAMYQMSAKELSVRIMEDILEHTGITATAGLEQICIWPKLHWISQQSM